jgi:hypothetical protein
MHLAYIISAYRYPHQLMRLVRRLHAPGTSFFLHLDKKAGPAIARQVADGLRPLAGVHLLPRHDCYWGDFGHVAATLKGIDALLRTGADFDYAVLLTGQDYPIKSNDHIRRFLAAHRGALFLDHFPLPHDAWQHGGLDRIEAWHLRLKGRHVTLGRGQLIPFRRRFPGSFRPFGGSSYWCLPRRAVEYIAAFTRRKPGFVRFFKLVDVPDELFFQTILMNSPLREAVVNDDLRYIDWRDPDAGSPAVLGVADFEALAASPKLFARKFDVTVDGRVLDLIDELLLGLPPDPPRA